jgi:hypothetical protein
MRDAPNRRSGLVTLAEHTVEGVDVSLMGVVERHWCQIRFVVIMEAAVGAQFQIVIAPLVPTVNFAPFTLNRELVNSLDVPKPPRVQRDSTVSLTVVGNDAPQKDVTSLCTALVMSARSMAPESVARSKDATNLFGPPVRAASCIIATRDVRVRAAIEQLRQQATSV